MSRRSKSHRFKGTRKKKGGSCNIIEEPIFVEESSSSCIASHISQMKKTSKTSLPEKNKEMF